MGRIIGVDLGTTNSVVAYWKGKKPRIIENEYSAFTPSVVWLERGVRRVGRDAKDRLNVGSRNIVFSIKRFMGVDYDDPYAQIALSKMNYEVRKALSGEVEIALDGQYFSPVQVSAMILEQVKKDAEIKLGEAVSHAVITVPAYFGQRQKNATREAGQLAGLTVPRIISEPTAAALAFGVEEDIDEPQDVLVYDLGGGTFDVSILSIIDNNFDVLNIDGDRFLGGDDFDALIIDQLAEQIWRRDRINLNEKRIENEAVCGRLKVVAERAKIELSRSEEVQISEFLGAIDGRPINVSLNLTRQQLETSVAPLIDNSIEIVMRALEGASLRPGDLDRVLLVGGSTRVPLVRRRLKELFGDRIQIDVDPMQCVALGAAVQTAFLTEEELNAAPVTEVSSLIPTSPVVIEKASDLPAITMQDMIPKWIGIETVNGDIVSVIPKGTLYPTHEPFKQIFETNHSSQQIYELPIFESELETNSDGKWEAIGKVRNERLPPGLPKGSDIMVEMSVDADGVLSVVSYLKNDPYRDDPERTTMEKRSFIFVGTGSTPDQNDGLLGRLDFFAFALRAMTEDARLARHLSMEQSHTTQTMASRAEAVVRAGDVVQAQGLMEEIDQLIADLPAQVPPMFLAFVITSNQDVISPVERGQVQQLMTQMETAVDRGDFDTANHHLRNLRLKNEELLEKYPTNLLKRKLG